MNKILIAILILLCAQGILPEDCQAFEIRRVVLVGPVDTAKHQSKAHEKLVNEHLAKVFRYPFYEVVAAAQLDIVPNKGVLENIATKYQAEIVVATEFARLRSFLYSRGFLGDETWQEIDLRLVMYTYNANDKQYTTFSVNRSINEPMSANNGDYELLDEAMEEVLKKLQFKRVPTDAKI